MKLSRFALCLTAATLLTLQVACDLWNKASGPRDAGAVAPSSQPSPSPQPAQEGGSGSTSGLRTGISVDMPLVTALSEDHWAQVEGEPGWTYEWTVEGATITSGWASNVLRYVAGDSGKVRLRCKYRDGAGRETITSMEQIIVSPPILSVFEALPTVITQGSEASLRWEAKEVARLELEPGNQDVIKAETVKVKPAQTTTYTLTATNQAGTQVHKTLDVKVVPPPAISRFNTEEALRLGQPGTLRAEFANGTAEIRLGATVLAASQDSPLRVQVTPTSGAVYTLFVTNEAGAAVTMSLTVSTQPLGK